MTCFEAQSHLEKMGVPPEVLAVVAAEVRRLPVERQRNNGQALMTWAVKLQAVHVLLERGEFIAAAEYRQSADTFLKALRGVRRCTKPRSDR